MRREFLFAASFLFFVVFSVQAQASRVSVEPTISDMGVCKLSFTNQLVRITNVGPVTDTYKLTSDADLTTFAGCNKGSISNDEVVLASGESALCSVFFNPFNDTIVQKYGVTIKANSLSSADNLAAKINVDVLACNAVSLAAQGSAKTCARDKFSTTIVVKNIGRVTETFNLSSDAAGKFDNPTLKLAAGQSAIVNFETYYANVSANKIRFFATSPDSFAAAEASMDVNVKECFTFDAFVNPVIPACIRSPSSFELVVKNTGTKPDVYLISAGSEQTQLAINASENETFKIIYTHDTVEKFKLGIGVKSVGSDFVKKISAESNVTECGAIGITSALASGSVCKGETFVFPVNVRNLGTITDTYNLTSNLGGLDVSKVTLVPGNSVDIHLTINTTGFAENKTYDATVSVAAGSLKKDAKFTLNVPVCHSAEMQVIPPSLNVCAPDRASFTLVLKNTGLKTETFALFAAGKMIANNLLLQPNANKSVDFVANYSNESGIYGIAIAAKSDNVELKSTAALVVSDPKSCYGSSFTPKDVEKSINPLDRNLQEIQLRNTGIKTLNYMLQAIGPSWISVGVGNITLAPNETGKIYLFIAPPFGTRLGNYSTTVIAISEKGIPASIDFTASIVGPTTTTTTIATTTTLPSGSGNRGIVVVGIILAIAAILVLRYIFTSK
ncbi:MAG: hypothetical protein V1836_03040 [Candidatus Aenigmatarchaeota archaeon]